MGKQASLFGDAGPPANAQLSAFIKSIRLRRTEDAALWFVSLWRSGATYRERAQRRLLISAGEDCLNIQAMQLVSEWYNGPARFDLHAAVGEIVRITQTRNWYQTDAGRRYIQHWYEAELTGNPYLSRSPDCLLSVIEYAVREQSLCAAMHGFNAFYRHRESNRWKLAQLLTRLALESGSQPAMALAELFEGNARHLWHDGNYSGQALYTLVAGPMDESYYARVVRNDAVTLIALTQQPLSPDVITFNDDGVTQLTARVMARQTGADVMTVPPWCLDGIHTGGSDRRFAGTLKQMYAMCRAYEYYGRLDPADEFLPEFYEVDGSQSHSVAP